MFKGAFCALTGRAAFLFRGNVDNPSLHQLSGRQHLCLSVILQPQVGNLLLTPQVAESVLQLGQLNEEVVFRIQKWRTHWTFEVK
jgi:hypothetical protein